MDSYFTKTANINVIQSPVAFKPSKHALNRCAPIVYLPPFISLREQVFLVRRIYFDNRLCSILLFDKLPQLLTTISSIGNDILWEMKKAAPPSGGIQPSVAKRKPFKQR